MSSAFFHFLAVAARVLGALTVVALFAIAIVLLRRARSGAYYVVREEARNRGLRLIVIAVVLIPVVLLLSIYADYLAVRPISLASSTSTPVPTTTFVLLTSTFTPEPPTDTPLPRPTTTPLPVPTATASSTRIPPTDLPPTLLTPVPSAVPAAESASFGPIQVGSGYVNFQLVGIGNVFPRDTPLIHATFLVRNLNRNAVWTAAWYRDGNYVAGDPLLWTSVPNTIGHVFYGQPGGFRPGRWELRLYIEDRLQSKASFTILNATSTPTITPTSTPSVTSTITG
jgi:hypothetical protein